MKYQTIYESFRPQKIEILKMILKDHGLDFRVLKGNPHTAVPSGTKIQVREAQKKEAIQLLRERGFYPRHPRFTGESPSGRFWIYLLLALVLINIVAIVLGL